MKKKENHILDYLMSNRDIYLSGNYISSKLGISRAAVWKKICGLRQKGYRISARPNCGYRLDEEPDQLNKDLLEEKNIVFYQAVDSTNLAIRRLAEQGLPGYSTLIAEEQLKGRGRLGRNWFSPPNSGLWFSLLLRPELLSPAAAAPVTLVTAAVLAKNLREKHALPITIKWPNDLLVNGIKFGGILSELKGEPDRIDYLVIGVGLNINQQQSDFPAELSAQATSLFAESGRHFDRTSLFLAMWNDLVQAYKHFFKQGFAPFRDQILQYNSFIGQEVNVKWPGGTLKGFASDLTAEGALLIKDKKGKTRVVNYGEIW